MARHWRLALVPLVTTIGFVLACLGGTPGELGKGAFKGDDCVDTGCLPDELPDRIAVGARQPVLWAGTGIFNSDEAVTDIDAAAPDLLVEVEPNQFMASAPGVFAVLALDSQARVVEIVHLTFVDAEGALFAAGSRVQGPLEVAVGEMVRVTVKPIRANGSVVGGELDCAWSGPDAVSWEADGCSVVVESDAAGAWTWSIDTWLGPLTLVLEVT
ncbi:MAG: hypothetical protein ACI9K2_006001 [Myxococcota bacterium]|jgi:hypothetical protein